MRVALDNQVPIDLIKAIEADGFEVVYWAGTEPDHWWFKEAIDEGAEVFVSPDYDIAIMASNSNRAFVRVKQSMGGDRLFSYLLKNLRKVRKEYSKSGHYIEII